MCPTAVIFDGGFALAENEEQLFQSLQYGGNLEIKDLLNLEQAYVYACNKHCEREYWRCYGRRIYLPKFKDMIKNPIFLNADLIPYQEPAYRIFAACSPNSVAILDSRDAIIAFTQQIKNFKIKEVSNPDEAQRYLDFQFLKHILPFGAYVQTPIPRCPQIDINTIVTVSFAQWFQNNITPQTIPNDIFNAQFNNFNYQSVTSLQNPDYEKRLLDMVDQPNKTIDSINLNVT